MYSTVQYSSLTFRIYSYHFILLHCIRPPNLTFCFVQFSIQNIVLSKFRSYIKHTVYILFFLIALSQLKRVTRFWPLSASDSVLLHVDASRAQIQGLLSLVAPEAASATAGTSAAASSPSPSALELQQQIERIIVFERQSLCLPLLSTAPPRFTGRHLL